MEFDREVAALSRLQFGCFARRQVRALGMSAYQVRRRLDTGRWEAAHHGALRLAGVPATFEGEVMAAQLALADASAGSATAGQLWEFAPLMRTPITMLRLHGRRHRLEGVVVRQSRCLPPEHLTTLGPIRLTTRARTIFDLARDVGMQRLGRILDGQLSEGTMTLEELAAVYEVLANPARRWGGTIARLLDERGDGEAVPASVLEELYRTVCRANGLPGGTRQFRAPWLDSNDLSDERVDVAYPAERLIVELDGRKFHGQFLGIETDRRRDQRAIAAGWRTARFTWRQLTTEPDVVVDTVTAALALGPRPTT